MDSEKKEFMVSMGFLVAKHGIAAAIKIANSWGKKEEPTIEEIRKLKHILPPAADFFDKK